VPTNGRVANGAIVEREIPAAFSSEAVLSLQLRNPDFSTAVRITDAINAYCAEPLRPQGRHRAGFPHRPSAPPRWGLHRPFLVGTGKPGGGIRHPGARRGRRADRHDRHRPGRPHRAGRRQPWQPHRRITEMPRVVQPEPFSFGETEIEPFTQIEVDEEDGRVGILDGSDLESLVAGLNSLGVKPDGIIAILQGIKSAGALQGELVLQ
jgi:flagellar P-ring protein FlgI